MNKIPIRLIKWYQRLHAASGGSHCRYSPTCSNYALEAFSKFGFFKAGFLTFYRILRCNPLSKGGYDPVPSTKMEKLFKDFFE